MKVKLAEVIDALDFTYDEIEYYYNPDKHFLCCWKNTFPIFYDFPIKKCH